MSDEDPFLTYLGDDEPPSAYDCRGRTAVVVGGAMGGLAAAHALGTLGYDVRLLERQRYEEKRVNCGEAMTHGAAIPLPKTPEFGFTNHTPAFEVEIYTGAAADRTFAGSGRFPSPDGYITDRNVVERRWAELLDERGVTVEDGYGVTKAEFRSFADEYDLVVDATGQPSMASKVDGRTGEYVGAMTAVNADVEGDFSDLYPDSLIVFENYLGYSWAFPKSETRANVGIGWASDRRPGDYMEAFADACERNDWPVPTREEAHVYTIPRGPSLDPKRTYLPTERIVRVGDAAGIANRFTGKGISQAVDSSYLMARLAAENRLGDYPSELYRSLRDEYRLAYIVRGALEDGRPDILGGIVEAVSGIDVESVDRNPGEAAARLLRRPRLVSQLLSNSTMRRRLYRAYTDDWEFERHADPT